MAAIEKQMQQSCEETLDAPEPEMAEERMEVDEEEESFEVEVKTDSKKATARDGSKATGRQFFQMRSSKGTPSSGQEKGSMGKPEMAPEVSKNANVKEEKPEMAEKKRKKDKKSKAKSPDPPTGGPPGPPPPEPPTVEAVPHLKPDMAQQWFFDALARDGQHVFFKLWPAVASSTSLDLRVVRKVAKKAAVVKGNLGGSFFGGTNPYGFLSGMAAP